MACTIRAAVVAVAMMATLSSPAQARQQAPGLAPGIAPWGFDLAGRDLSVRPGQDFNLHANGTYERNTEFPPDRARMTMFGRLQEKTQSDLKAIIEDAVAAPSATEEATLIDAMYRSFMDEAAVEAAGATPIGDDLAAIRSATSHEDLAALLARSLSGFGARLFKVELLEDAKAPTLYALHVSQGGLGLPNRDYYLEDRFADQKKAYRDYVATLLVLADWADAEAAADAVVAFETQLARGHWPRERSREIDDVYHPWARDQLAQASPGFAWESWIDGAGLGNLERVIVLEDTAVRDGAQLFGETPLATLQAWAAFHLAHDAAPYLSSAFVKARFDMFGKGLGGQQADRPRWRRGVALVDATLGEALGREYVARHFTPQARQRVQEMVDHILKAMESRLLVVDWMGEATRAEALKKIRKFGVKVGYPDVWRSYAGLRLDPADLFGNVQRARAFDWAFERSRVDAPIDPRSWAMTPQTVSAYYDPPRNEIVFPAALLQAPFFDVDADPAVNFGGIGAVIGHEVVHGFDDQGRKIDADGVLDDWWTAEDAARFEARADELVAQYDALNPVEDMHVNGRLTLGENIADLGGLLLALDAYRLSLNGGPAPVLDGLTGDQRLFLGWAQIWRGKIRDGALRQQLVVDSHAPDAIRASHTPRNVDAWYEAFDVSPSDAGYLAPTERVRLW